MFLGGFFVVVVFNFFFLSYDVDAVLQKRKKKTKGNYILTMVYLIAISVGISGVLLHKPQYKQSWKTATL